MKSNTRSIASSLIGFDTRDMLMLETKDKDIKRELCREGLTEWLIKFGMRWVAWQEIGDMIALGYPEREKYLERHTDRVRVDDYLKYRLTQKGLEFINETR